MDVNTRKRQSASSAPSTQPAKKRRQVVDKQELARTVLYLAPRYLSTKSGQPQLSCRALYEEARLLLGLENSWQSLRGMFTKWRKAEAGAWEQMQGEADNDEEAYFADLIEREEELKRQRGSVAQDVGSANGSGPKQGCGSGEAAAEGETAPEKIPKQEEESDAESNETLHYDLGDAAPTIDQGGEDKEGGPKANQKFYFRIQSFNVFHNHFYAGGGEDGGGARRASESRWGWDWNVPPRM